MFQVKNQKWLKKEKEGINFPVVEMTISYEPTTFEETH